jgi:hypothetical protein
MGSQAPLAKLPSTSHHRAAVSGALSKPGGITESNGIHMALFGMHSRTFGPYLAAIIW